MEENRKGEWCISALKLQNLKRFILPQGFVHLKKGGICEKGPRWPDVVFKVSLHTWPVPLRPKLLKPGVSLLSPCASAQPQPAGPASGSWAIELGDYWECINSCHTQPPAFFLWVQLWSCWPSAPQAWIPALESSFCHCLVLTSVPGPRLYSSAAVPWKPLACLSGTSASSFGLSFVSCSNHEWYQPTRYSETQASS